MASARRLDRPQALGEQLVTALRSDILAGTLAPGEQLVEAAVAQSFSVSRGPVRDALRTLASEGLIAASGRSYEVVGLNEQDLRDLFDLRQILETAAAQRCVSVNLEDYRRSAQSAVEAMNAAAQAADVEAFIKADIDFHSALFAHCGNRRLVAIWEQQVPTFEELFRLTAALEESLSVSVDWHRSMLDTMIAGDREAITAAVTRLVTGGEEPIIAARQRLGSTGQE